MSNLIAKSIKIPTYSVRATIVQSEADLLNKHRNIIFGTMAIVSILIVGYYLGGATSITIPNNGIGSIFDSMPVYKTGLGAINGYAYGPSGLPAADATVIVAEQGGLSETKIGSVSPDGKYVFQDLNPGHYVIVADFHDGVYKALYNVVVGPGTIQTQYFKY